MQLDTQNTHLHTKTFQKWHLNVSVQPQHDCLRLLQHGCRPLFLFFKPQCTAGWETRKEHCSGFYFVFLFLWLNFKLRIRLSFSRCPIIPIWVYRTISASQFSLCSLHHFVVYFPVNLTPTLAAESKMTDPAMISHSSHFLLTLSSWTGQLSGQTLHSPHGGWGHFYCQWYWRWNFRPHKRAVIID